MDLNDPPLLASIQNIYQRFFADLYIEPPVPATQPDEVVRPRDIVAAPAEEEEAKKVIKEVKESTKAQKNGTPVNPKAKSKGAEVQKNLKEVIEEIPVVIPPPEPLFKPEPVVCPFEAQIAALQEEIGAQLQRNAEAVEELKKRHAELAAGSHEQTFNASRLMEHASRLVDGCINIAKIIQEQDAQFSEAYKVPSALQEAADYDLDKADRASSGMSFAKTNMVAAACEVTQWVWASPPKKKKPVVCEDAALLNAEQAAMTRMNATANYLMNPRYMPPGAKTTIQEKLRSVSEATTIKQLKYVQPIAACPLRLTQLDAANGKSGPVLLCAEPSVLTFTGYKAGGTYEQTIKIRNVSGLSRRCRVMPPKTPQFSVSLDKPVNLSRSYEFQRNSKLLRSQTPDEADQNPSGLLAPGMAVSYVVRFSPDALCNYEDRLLVCCEWSSFEVPLRAARVPPSLSLPDMFDCGYCMVYGTVTKEFKLVNKGGEATFFLTGQAADAAADTCSGTLVVPPFTVAPQKFVLRTGESLDLVVSFNPTDAAAYSSEMYLLCENMDTVCYTIKGVGVDPYVTLMSVHGQPCNAEPPFFTNNSLLSFGDLSIGAMDAKALCYHNPTEIAVKFHWEVDIPESNCPPMDGQDDAFMVIPDQGTFQPKEELRFMVQFNPRLVTVYKAQLRLVLEGCSPNWTVKPPFATESISLDSTMDGSGFFSSGRFAQRPDNGTTVSIVEAVGSGIPLDISLVPATLGNLQSPYIAGANLVSQRQITLVNNSSRSAWFCFDALEEEQRLIASGDEAALRPLSHPRPKVQVNEALALERGARLSFIPRLGCSLPGTSTVITIQHSFPNPGTVDCCIDCAVQWMPQPLQLKFIARVEGANLRLEPKMLDYGIIDGLQEVVREVIVHNDSEVPVSFSLHSAADAEREVAWRSETAALQAKKSEALQRIAMSGGLLKPDPQLEAPCPAFQPMYRFTPATGKLAPFQKTAVKVGYTPVEYTKVTDRIEIRIPGSKTQLLHVKGDVQAGNVCILPPVLELAEAYLEVPLKRTVILQNLSSVDTAFQWAVIEDTSVAETTFDTPNGLLKGGERREITMSITVHRPGPLHYLVPCCLSGVEQPVACAVTCPNVNGAQLSFTVSPTKPLNPSMDCEDGRSIQDYAWHLAQNMIDIATGITPQQWLPVVDYGQVQIRAEPTERHLTIRNHSGSKVEVRCCFEGYGVDDDFATLMARANGEQKEKVDGLLGNSHEKTKTFTSKGGSSYIQQRTHSTALQKFTDAAIDQAGNAGLAFLLDQPPNTGYKIAPGGILSIPMWCVAKLPGVYEDYLVVLGDEMKGLPQVKIPVRVEVIGVPLVLQKITTGVSLGPGPGATIKFPPFLVGNVSASHTKQFQLTNVCPERLHLEWYSENDTGLCFSVEPHSAAIAPNATLTFTATFTGPSGVASANFHSIWLCKSQRGQPFPLVLDASVMMPTLSVDPKKVKFKDCPVTSGQLTKTIRLSNPYSMPLEFTAAFGNANDTSVELLKAVHIPDPADLGSSNVMKVLPVHSRFKLFSREALDLTIAFTPSLCSSFLDDGIDGGIRTHRMAAQLCLQFQGSTQVIEVDATVHYPFVSINQSQLTFTPSGNDAAWPKTVTLTNNTIVPAKYEVYYIPNANPVSTQASHPPADTPVERLNEAMDQQIPIDEPAAFAITPQTGVVPAKVNNQAGEHTLTVHFKPLHAATYCSSFRIDVLHGSGCELQLKGIKPLQEHAEIMTRTLAPEALYMQ